VRPRIFISHSAKEPAAREILDAVIAELEADGGFELLVDVKQLGAGDPWREQIYGWLSTCHAAVAVLSEAAIQSSDWVDKEMFTAQVRRGHDPDFLVLPILVAPVSVEDLKSKKLEALALDEVQHIPQGNPASVARAVREHPKLQALKERYGSDSPHHAIETHLSAVLRRFDPAVLKLAASRLDLDLTAWTPDPARAMAQRMLEADLNSLYEAARELKPADPDAALKAFEYAAPGWVDWAAASRILAVTKEGVPPRAVAINSETRLTCEMYVRRARFDMPFGWLPRPESEDVVADLHAAVRATLIEWGYGAETDSDEQIDSLLSRDPSVVLILPVEVPDCEVVSAAMKPFKHLTVLVPAGPTGRVFLHRCGLDYAVYLEPELEPDREREAVANYKFAHGRLGSGNQRGDGDVLQEAV
jgi:hypothetical protein